jgi:hypothetical protein
MVPAVVKPNRAALIVAAALALGATPARAHPEMSPQLVNRYLSLILLGDQLQYFATYLYGPLPAVTERERMDSDHDGRISDQERAAAEAGWRQRARELLSLQVDGVAVPITDAKAEIQLANDATTGAAPLVVEVYGAHPLSPATHRLRLDPAWDPPSLGETELSVDASADWELVSSHQATGPDQQLTRYKLEGGRTASIQDRSATFTVRPRAHPSPPLPRYLPTAIALVLVAGAGLAFDRIRRRQSRADGSGGPGSQKGGS